MLIMHFVHYLIFSRVQVIFWFGIEPCSNRRRCHMNALPDLITHVPEIGAREMESISGAGFWSVCHGFN